jgi:hypothetical protein
MAFKAASVFYVFKNVEDCSLLYCYCKDLNEWILVFGSFSFLNLSLRCMNVKELKIGDAVHLKSGDFLSVYTMTVVAIEKDVATVSWKEPYKRKIKEFKVNVPVNDLVHEKNRRYKLKDKFGFDVCLN